MSSFEFSIDSIKTYWPHLIVMIISGTLLVILIAPLILFITGIYSADMLLTADCRKSFISYTLYLYLYFFESTGSNLIIILLLLGFFLGLFIRAINIVFWNDIAPRSSFLENIVSDQKNVPSPGTLDYARFQIFIYKTPYVKKYVDWEWFLEQVYGYILSVFVIYLLVYLLHTIVMVVNLFLPVITIWVIIEVTISLAVMISLLIIIFRTSQLHKARSICAKSVAYELYENERGTQ